MSRNVIIDLETNDLFEFKDNKTGHTAMNKKYNALLKQRGLSSMIRVVYGLPDRKEK